MKTTKKTAKTILRLISATMLICCTISFNLFANSEFMAISIILFLGFGVFLLGISFNDVRVKDRTEMLKNVKDNVKEC